MSIRISARYPDVAVRNGLMGQSGGPGSVTYIGTPHHILTQDLDHIVTQGGDTISTDMVLDASYYNRIVPHA